jgi:hypothetical protein
MRASVGSLAEVAAGEVVAVGTLGVAVDAVFAGVADAPGFGVAAGVAEVDVAPRSPVAPLRALGALGAPARLTSKRLGPLGVTAVRVPVLFGEAVFVFAGGARAAPLDDFALASASEVTAGAESQAVISRATNSPAAANTLDIL